MYNKFITTIPNTRLKFNRSTTFLAVILLVWLFFIIHIFPDISLNPRSIQMIVSINKSKLQSIDAERNLIESRILFVDMVKLEQSNRLIHPTIGDLNAVENVFVDFLAHLEVKQEGDFYFEIASDDGFRLYIDGNTIAEFTGDRPYATSYAQAHLTKGIHLIKLEYFQGYGSTGLEMKYSFEKKKYVTFGKPLPQACVLPMIGK